MVKVVMKFLKSKKIQLQSRSFLNAYLKMFPAKLAWFFYDQIFLWQSIFVITK